MPPRRRHHSDIPTGQLYDRRQANPAAPPVAPRRDGSVVHHNQLHSSSAPDVRLTIADDANLRGRGRNRRNRNNIANGSGVVEWIGSYSKEGNRFFPVLSLILAIVAIHSYVMVPLQWAFKVGNGLNFYLTTLFEVAFFLDAVCQLLSAYLMNNQAMERLSSFKFIEGNLRKILEIAAALPFSLLYENLVLLKVVRALRVKELFERFENRFMTLTGFVIGFLKLITIQFYCFHLAGCIFYYLDTTSNSISEETWLSHLEIGGKNITGLGIEQKYIVSLYFGSVTLSTIGFGDISAVNVKEMVAVVCLNIFSLIMWTYLGVRYTNLFGRISRAHLAREKWLKILKCLRNANTNEALVKHMRDQIYNDDNDNGFLEDLPASIRTKAARIFKTSVIRSVSLFSGCSSKFIQHLASEFQEESYFQGETLLEEGSSVNQLYILFSGTLEQWQGRNQRPQAEHILPTGIFGLDSLILGVLLPNTLRAYETSKVLLLSKRCFLEALEIYLDDRAIVSKNLTMGRDSDFEARLLASEFGFMMGVNRETTEMDHRNPTPHQDSGVGGATFTPRTSNRFDLLESETT